MHRLRLRILALAGLLVLVSQFGSIAAVVYTGNRAVRIQTVRMLERAGSVSAPLSQERAARLRTAGAMLAADPAFLRALRDGDTPAAATLLETQRQRAEVDLGMLLDSQGRVLAAPDSIRRLHVNLPRLTSRAGGTNASRTVIRAGERAYEVVAVPVGDTEAVAWLALGTALDRSLATRMSSLTGLDATLLARAGGSYSVLGSSLAQLDAAAVLKQLDEAVSPESTPLTFAADGIGHVAVLLPLIPGDGDVRILLSQPVDAMLGPFASLRRSILLMSSVALALALAGGVFLSRAISAPVQTLVQAARRIRDGDYGQPVDLRADGEVAELAHALNAMQASISEREERITYHARFDALTGLPTRLAALEALEGAIRDAGVRQEPVTVMLIDLNNFSEIGWSLGYDIGDALRCQAAERLRGGLDPSHLLARLEGDQFLAILAGCDLEEAREAAGDLLRLLGAGLSVREVSVSVEARIGLAAYPLHADDSEQLLKRVAVARSDAFSARTPVFTYAPGNEERHLRQLAILADIRGATRHDELRLYLQPKIRLADGRICGAEALVRWEHPVFGFLTPDSFIPLAEKSGNISLITNWALATAVRECRFWLEEGLDLPVSVNLSGRDLQNRDLPCFVLELLRDHDLAARNLVLEITEEAVVQDFQQATLVLECLHDLGVRISVDDFGTGYSSLAQLKHLPVDELKIDRTFVIDLPADGADAAIVRTAIDLAHNLGLEVVAEGVETPQALKWLQTHGCERAQGYLIGKPMPADQFTAWVRNYELDDTRPSVVLRIAS